MKLQTAIEILEYHQEWRLGKRDDMVHEPKKLTEALDIVLSEVKKFRIGVVMPSLPADRWDAEDFLIEKGISNHPRVSDCNNKESYEVADLMAEFANRYYSNEC